jgi:hypothetical protein
MKTRTLVLAIAAVMLTGMVSAQNKKEKVSAKNEKETVATIDGPSFSWNESTHEFGKIHKGTPVATTFDFTNNGNKPILISNVGTSCGCTVADYSKESILPGKKGYVKVTYNAANGGVFNKTVTVHANTTPESTFLNIKGEVIATESAAK